MYKRIEKAKENASEILKKLYNHHGAPYAPFLIHRGNPTTYFRIYFSHSLKKRETIASFRFNLKGAFYG